MLTNSNFNFSKYKKYDEAVLNYMNNATSMSLSEAGANSYVNINNIYINNKQYYSDDEKVDNILFYELGKVKVNLLKETLESLGIDFSYTHNPIQYINYAKNVPIELQSLSDIGDLAGLIGAEGTGFSKPGGYLTTEQQAANAKIIFTYLVGKLGLTNAGAVGAIANMMQESGLNPGAYNKGEATGTYRGSSANGGGYGAGIIQWSLDWKWEEERRIGMKIEQAPLGLQLALVANALLGGKMASRYEKFKQAENVYKDPQHLASAWLAAIEMPGLWSRFSRTGTCGGAGQEGARIANCSKVINMLKA